MTARNETLALSFIPSTKTEVGVWKRFVRVVFFTSTKREVGVENPIRSDDLKSQHPVSLTYLILKNFKRDFTKTKKPFGSPRRTVYSPTNGNKTSNPLFWLTFFDIDVQNKRKKFGMETFFVKPFW